MAGASQTTSPAGAIRSPNEWDGIGAVPDFHLIRIPNNLAVKPHRQVGDQQCFRKMRGKSVESTKGRRAASTRLEPLLVMTLLGSPREGRLGRLVIAEALLGQ